MGFSSEQQQLTSSAEKFQEVAEAAKIAKDQTQKIKTLSDTPKNLGVKPILTQASSVNGTDDEKAFTTGPANS